MKLRKFFVVIFVLSAFEVFSQDDSLQIDEDNTPIVLPDAFNTTRIINSHSTNVRDAHALDFQIMHRFGPFNQGGFNLFGLDEASLRLGLEYGITRRLMVALGRSSSGKNYDAFVKYQLLKQSKGKGGIPINLTLFGSTAFSSVSYRNQKELTGNTDLIDQFVYTSQILMSRRFSKLLSLQLSPTYIHKNVVEQELQNDFFSIGAGARLKLAGRLHLTADYYVRLNNITKELYNPLAVGLDIVTGGHVFQVYATNSIGMIEKEFITNTFDSVQNGGVRLGFSVSRVFMLKSQVDGGSIK